MSTPINAYFLQRDSAEEVKEALTPPFEVEGPTMVVPNEGRAWLLVISMPPGMNPSPAYANPQLMMMINRQVMAHDGVVTEQETRQATMSSYPNRLSSPLPDSVLDRYYAEHPDETDMRTPKTAKKAKVEQPTLSEIEEFFTAE